MAERIPDLWRAKEDVLRLYEIYLIRLSMNRLHERIVSACRQIRRYASRGPGPREGLFTFSIEIDALCELGRYQTAWRQLRLREEILFGRRLDLARRRWSAREAPLLPWDYVSLLFFLGRYRLGCALLETALGFSFRGKKVPSYDLLLYVYNDDEEPRNRYRVTLAHFYARLGRELREWRHWPAFVNGFSEKLFRLAGVGRAELLADSGRLPTFVGNLEQILRERTPTRITRGQADLIESPAKVRKWQEATQAKLEAFEERIQPVREEREAKLEELFPELRGLRR